MRGFWKKLAYRITNRKYITNIILNKLLNTLAGLTITKRLINQ